MSFRITSIALLALLAGCAQVAGLPDATGQVRIWEGEAAVKGGNLLTPARGEATGKGCIVSEVGVPQSQVWYVGERCRVCYHCTPAPVEERP